MTWYLTGRRLRLSADTVLLFGGAHLGQKTKEEMAVLKFKEAQTRDKKETVRRRRRTWWCGWRRPGTDLPLWRNCARHGMGRFQPKKNKSEGAIIKPAEKDGQLDDLISVLRTGQGAMSFSRAPHPARRWTRP